MSNPVLNKNWFPHLVAVLLFLVVSLVYFLPQIQGEKLKTHDISSFEGASKEIQDYRAETGEEALWTNSMFGGMPAFFISTLYVKNIPKKIELALSLGFQRPIGTFFLLCLGFYFLLIVLDVNPWIAMGIALGFGYSSWFLISMAAGHATKLRAISWMAPTIAGVILAMKKKYWFALGITSLAVLLKHFRQPSPNHVLFNYLCIHRMVWICHRCL